MKKIVKVKKEEKCCALNSNGYRCRNKATRSVAYHGDSEIYNRYDKESIRWVKIKICRMHYNANFP